jgi:sortase A
LKKYILGIVGIVIIVAIALAFTLPFGSANIETKHYQNGEISFDYPANWQQVSAKGSQVVAFNDPETGLNVSVSRQVIPPGYNVPENFVPELVKATESNITLASSNSISLNGNQGYENIYNVKKNGSTA